MSRKFFRRYLTFVKKYIHYPIIFLLVVIIGYLVKINYLDESSYKRVIRTFTQNTPTLVPTPTPTETPEETKKKIIELTNEEREKIGLNPLKESPLLDSSAEEKANDMITKDYWSHINPQGAQPWVLFGKVGYRYQHAGENLAKDFNSSEQTITAWMNSPGHKENIVNGNYKEIGVAVIDGVLEGRKTRFVVQHFGTPYTMNTVASKTGRVISYKEWCTGKEINIYENEIIIKKASDGNTYGMTVGDWSCYEKDSNAGLLNHIPSRTGNIIPYHEWCTGKDISIYENEKVYRKLDDGKVYWLTAGDWECYDKGMPKK